MHRYSNLPKLGIWDSSHQSQDVTRPRGQVHVVARRLSAETITQLVRDYESGVESTELTYRYPLGKGPVLKLLRDRGVEIRRQGLSPAQIDEAVQLYADGWSLARIGERYGCAHTVVRKALLDRGVSMRPRRGWHY